MLAIETRGLCKAYRGRNVVDGLDMHVARGDIYGFVGRNGAGKSTTMKMICGMIRPTRGEVRLLDRLVADPSGSAEYSEAVRIGALVESPGLYPNMTAFDNMRCKAIALGIVDDVGEIEQLLSVVGLGSAGGKRTENYSMGMKQRLGLAGALLGSPKLIFLDEPTNGLDPSGIHEMRELIKSLPRQFGMTVMVSSHLLSEIEQTADHIGIISSGQLIFQDTLHILRSRNVRQIHLRTSNDEGAAALLKEQIEVPGPASLSYSPEQGILIPFLPEAVLRRLLRRIWENGIDLYRIEERSESLEDIYLGMVKEAGL